MRNIRNKNTDTNIDVESTKEKLNELFNEEAEHEYVQSLCKEITEELIEEEKDADTKLEEEINKIDEEAEKIEDKPLEEKNEIICVKRNKKENEKDISYVIILCTLVICFLLTTFLFVLDSKKENNFLNKMKVQINEVLKWQKEKEKLNLKARLCLG